MKTRKVNLLQAAAEIAIVTFAFTQGWGIGLLAIGCMLTCSWVRVRAMEKIATLKA